jgi:hypothetical protein
MHTPESTGRGSVSDLTANGGETITASFTVINTGAGTDVPQLYLTEAPGETRLGLLEFEWVQLRPGESRQVMITMQRGSRRRKRKEA